jgi:hypothetical protein
VSQVLRVQWQLHDTAPQCSKPPLSPSAREGSAAAPSPIWL